MLLAMLVACARPSAPAVAPSETRAWLRVIEPIVRRACLPCHAPGGDADIDLSTADRWHHLRWKIHRRTVIERTMPPEVPLAEAELATLRLWLER